MKKLLIIIFLIFFIPVYALADRVRYKYANGDYRISEIGGQHVRYEYANGEYRISSIGGQPVRYEYANGGYRISSIGGQRVSYTYSNGAYRISRIGDQRVNYRYTNGDYRISEIGGRRVRYEYANGKYRVSDIEGCSHYNNEAVLGVTGSKNNQPNTVRYYSAENIKKLEQLEKERKLKMPEPINEKEYKEYTYDEKKKNEYGYIYIERDIADAKNYGYVISNRRNNIKWYIRDGILIEYSTYGGERFKYSYYLDENNNVAKYGYKKPDTKNKIKYCFKLMFPDYEAKSVFKQTKEYKESKNSVQFPEITEYDMNGNILTVYRKYSDYYIREYDSTGKLKGVHKGYYNSILPFLLWKDYDPSNYLVTGKWTNKK